MSATIELPMINQAAILNSRTGPCLIVEVPLEQEKSIRDALDTLSRMNERGSAQTILDALRTAAEQSYFWTPEWQAGEREAERDLAEGRTRTFDTMEEMFSGCTMKFKPTKHFWNGYARLPTPVKQRAQQAFQLFQQGAQHPPFHLLV